MHFEPLIRFPSEPTELAWCFAFVDGHLLLPAEEPDIAPRPLVARQRQRCKVWDQRPFVCRMHFLPGEPIDPKDPRWPKEVKAFNVRMPLRQHVALMQTEKRMLLTPAPFLNANVLQWLQLAEGQLLAEVGEAPLRFTADGQPAPKANRNNPAAKKFEKDKRRRK